jgi:hypothetical protein
MPAFPAISGFVISPRRSGSEEEIPSVQPGVRRRHRQTVRLPAGARTKPSVCGTGFNRCHPPPCPTVPLSDCRQAAPPTALLPGVNNLNMPALRETLTTNPPAA